MTFTEFAEDFIANSRGLQSDMLRPGPQPDGNNRMIDAVFALENLAVDTSPLLRFLDLPEEASAAMPRRNQSIQRAQRSDLSEALQAALEEHLAADIALHNAAVAAGGTLIATPDSQIPLAKP